jgi:hypothetical protein
MTFIPPAQPPPFTAAGQGLLLARNYDRNGNAIKSIAIATAFLYGSVSVAESNQFTCIGRLMSCVVGRDTIGPVSPPGGLASIVYKYKAPGLNPQLQTVTRGIRPLLFRPRLRVLPL